MSTHEWCRAQDHRRRLRREGEQVQTSRSPRVARGTPSVRSMRPPSPKSGAAARSRRRRPRGAVASAPHDAGVAVVLPVRHAAVAPCAMAGIPTRRRGVVYPQGLAGAGVDGGGAVERGAHVEDAVDHQRRRHQRADRGPGARLPHPVPRRPQVGLVRLQDVEEGVGRDQRVAAGGGADEVGVDGAPAPPHPEVAEVLGRDLVERRVLGAAAVTRVAAPLAGVGRPVLRPGRGRGQATSRSDHRRQSADPLHGQHLGRSDGHSRPGGGGGPSSAAPPRRAVRRVLFGRLVPYSVPTVG